MKHYIFLLVLLLVSCEVIPDTEFTDRPVVCCYLSAGEIPSLTVSKLIPFQSDAPFSDEDVEKLDITITDLTTETEYSLKSIGGGVYSNDALIVEIGHNYRLSFKYDNVPVTAETTVPTLPENVSFSSTSIEVMSFMPRTESKAPQDGIEISWTNDDNEYYIVEGITTSTNSIRDVDEDDEMPSQSFKLNYTQGSSTSLSSSDFNYFGTYQVSVIHINPEYAVMSQGGSTSSATLVDVKGNIDGGYGIFTGISTVTKSIKVSQGSSPF